MDRATDEVISALIRSDTGALRDALAEFQGLDTGKSEDLSRLAQELIELRQSLTVTECHFQNLDAALWVGDLNRANLMNALGPSDFDPSITLDQLAESSPELIEASTYDTEDDENYFPDHVPIPTMPSDVPPDLYSEIADGKPGAIDAFIASGEDPNTPRGTAYHTALLAALDAPGRRIEHIAQLVDAGADPLVIHLAGDNALSWAAGYHHPDTVTEESEIALMTFLAGKGADPNHWTEVQNWNVLHRAIIQGDGKRVAGVLAAGAVVNVSVPKLFLPMKLAGCTVLMIAAPKPEVLRLLMQRGASVAETDAYGRNLLAFVREETISALARADTTDQWTVDFAKGLAASLALLTEQSGPQAPL